MYLKQVRESGEPITVLIRDEPVAYLVPISHRSKIPTPGKGSELYEFKSAFADLGLTLSSEDLRDYPLPKLTPVTADDGRKDLITVESMRTEKAW